MQQYPYHAPVVLTESDFLLFGGQTGTSSPAQRGMAFLLAEEQMTEYLNAFLVPTVTTGTYFWRTGNPIVLDYGHIIGVLRVTLSSVGGSNSCAIDTVTGCHAVRGDGRYGYIDVQALSNCSGCGSVVGLAPYNVEVVYESGLQTGTSNSPSMLQALTLAAQINLNEMDISLSNEGTADVGIQDFNSMSYSETRTKLGTTNFGNSATSQRIARLVRKYKAKPVIGLH